MRGFWTVALIVVAVGCHDDFPGRLKKGCGSAEECDHLLREAADRLRDCAKYPDRFAAGPWRERWRAGPNDAGTAPIKSC
jgi:hypothetical protein